MAQLKTVEEIVQELHKRMVEANRMAVHYASKGDQEQVTIQNRIWREMHNLIAMIER